jgi:acetyl esterase/lipase
MWPCLLGCLALLLACSSPASATTTHKTTPDTAAATNSTIPASDAQVQVTSGNEYYPRGPVFDAYVPTAPSTPRPALIMVHGGGWAGGDKAMLAKWAKRAAAEEGWDVFTVNYRLSGGDTIAWADELHDVQAAIRFINVYASRWNADPRKFMLLGDSAGANLVALVSSVGTTNPVKGSAVGGARDLAVGIVAVALWSPPTDLAQLVPIGGAPPVACTGNPACSFAWNSSAVVSYIGCEPADCPLSYVQASPISWVSPATVPSFVANGTDELIPIGQVQAYVDKLDANHVVNDFVILKTSLHSYQFGDVIWSDTASFLSTQLHAAFPDSGSTTPSGAGASRWISPIWIVIGVALLIIVVALVLSARHRRR